MKHALLGLIAETSIHAGAGKAVGVIDLPIMREAHSDWPCIFGSAVKGALRAKAEQQDHQWITDVFGPNTKNASDHAGAIAVGDARLLLMPIRSLSTHFKWVTCPALIQRAIQDAKRLNMEGVDVDFLKLENEQALTFNMKDNLFLEEFYFKAEKYDLDKLIKWLSQFVGGDFEERLKNQLVIVSDDVFSSIARYSTPVTPHIAIDNTKKTVVGGHLWYEETLSPETVLYVTLAAHPSRKDKTQSSAEQILADVLSMFPDNKPYLQLGGNETVGMGWCRVNRVKKVGA